MTHAHDPVSPFERLLDPSGDILLGFQLEKHSHDLRIGPTVQTAREGADAG